MTQQSKGQFWNTLIFYKGWKQPARNLIVVSDNHVFIKYMKDIFKLPFCLYDIPHQIGQNTSLWRKTFQKHVIYASFLLMR